MTRVDDVRKTIESMLGTLTPAKAQQLAKGMLEPDARKEQVAKAAGDLLEWSQKNRQRIRDLIRREIRDQLEQMGVASRADLDALKKRVRELERAAGMTASGRRAAGTGSGTKKSGARSGGGAAKASSSASSAKRAASPSKGSATGSASG